MYTCMHAPCSIYLCEHMSIYVYQCKYIYIYMYIYVHICLYIYVSYSTSTVSPPLSLYKDKGGEIVDVE